MVSVRLYLLLATGTVFAMTAQRIVAGEIEYMMVGFLVGMLFGVQIGTLLPDKMKTVERR
jgi:hypothetical protein